MTEVEKMQALEQQATMLRVADDLIAQRQKAEAERRIYDIAEHIEAELRRRMAPPGTLGLPPLLEERRLEYGIPDGVFRHHALYDRMFVYQIAARDFSEKAGDGVIVLTDQGKTREKEEAPRGIVVSAGMLALDHIRSNGSDLGRIVNFVRQSPWRMKVDTVGGHDFHVLVLRDGDLIADEDLANDIKLGRKVVEVANGQHQFIGIDGVACSPLAPKAPHIPEDY